MQQGRSINSQKILLVDHDIAEHRLLLEMIKQIDRNIHVDISVDPKGTFRKLKRAARVALPAAIIIHYDIGHLNSFGLISDLNDNDQYKPIKKLVWGEPREERFRELCLQTGALNYFVRPHRPSELKLTILQILMAAGLLERE